MRPPLISAPGRRRAADRTRFKTDTEASDKRYEVARPRAVAIESSRADDSTSASDGAQPIRESRAFTTASTPLQQYRLMVDRRPASACKDRVAPVGSRGPFGIALLMAGSISAHELP